MPNRKDRGLVVVDENEDGTTSVSVCSRIVDGRPVNVFALYERASRARISPDLLVKKRGRSRSTEEVADVYDDQGTVVVCKVAYSKL